MLTRVLYRFNSALERRLPEQRLFLKSDTATRFVRLRPLTQAIGLSAGALLLSWSIIATAILMMDSIGAGSGRDQTARQQVIYEKRLGALSDDRDLRAVEAHRAQERFNIALAQVAEMQEVLLASEERRKELETGIEVIQDTLRRTISERDEARGELQSMKVALSDETGSTQTPESRAKDAVSTLEFLSAALGATATERDAIQLDAEQARTETAAITLAKREIELRNDAIFTRLEEAVTISMEPLDNMFREAGMSPDALLDQVRRGYSGQGGPLTPFTVSTSGLQLSPDEVRTNAILTGLDRMNLYRIAATKSPFAMPVQGAFRFTSGFGYRNDPMGRGSRMHTGLDFAGGYGTPIVAPGEGVVVQAGWDGGYGRAITIRHEFGIETRYAHLSDIKVEVGQKVSRGDRIGDMGNSGRSTGTHLHYEIRIGGGAINPMTFIKAARDVF